MYVILNLTYTLRKAATKVKKRDKSTNQTQYWSTKWSEVNKNTTTGESLKYIFTRIFLNIEQYVKIEFTNLKKFKGMKR